MASDNADNGSGNTVGDKAGKDHQPEWANGLRQLYDSVVDEPLPDSFKDLLAQLDDSDDAVSHKQNDT